MYLQRDRWHVVWGYLHPSLLVISFIYANKRVHTKRQSPASTFLVSTSVSLYLGYKIHVLVLLNHHDNDANGLQPTKLTYWIRRLKLPTSIT